MDRDFRADSSTLRAEASTSLGDVRRTQRQSEMLEALGQNPQLSFPSVFTTKAALEGAYRLMENEHVPWRSLVEGHTNRSYERCEAADEVLVLHDTTDISYKIHDPDWIRDCMPRMSSQRQGFGLHCAIAVADDDVPLPLGLLASQPFAHLKHLSDERTEQYWREQGGVFENESKRWFDQVQEVREACAGRSIDPIHVMDREADSFTLLDTLMHERDRFVIRVRATDRRLAGGASTLSRALEDVAFVLKRQVRLGFRTPFRNAKKRRKHPPRKERQATLHFRAKTVTIDRGHSRDLGHAPVGRELPVTLTLNVVEAVELHPPQGQEGVRWLLWTTEPIDSPQQIERVVDIYRRRWLIEEFFKALKTGCKLEERQFRTADSILRMLALTMIIGWWLLATRAIMSWDENTSWRVVLDPFSFAMLRQSAEDEALKPDATVTEVLYAIASIGGHLQRNGPPGWLTLMRGMTTLADRVDGARQFAKALGIPAELPEM